MGTRARAKALAVLALLVLGSSPWSLSAAVPPLPAPLSFLVVNYGSMFIPGDDSPKLPEAQITQGSSLLFVNLDGATHSLTSTTFVDGVPLFTTPLVGTRGSADVQGVPALSPGSYGFYCLNHASLQGTLIVSAN